MNSVALVQKINSEEVLFLGNSIIQQNPSNYWATADTSCQFVKDKIGHHHFPRKQANITREYLSFPRKMVNPYSEFVLLIKIQNTSISQAKRRILTKQLILLVCLRFLQTSSFSQLRLFFLKHLKFRGKNTPKNAFF